MPRDAASRRPSRCVAGAIALRLAIGVGFANYDTLYSLVWGQQLARGADPELQAAARADPAPAARAARRDPRAARCRRRRSTIVVALAYLALAALGYLVYRLGARWFSWPVGLAAAALILSRYEVLSYGVRAYVDVPYVVLVLAALAVETRRRRAGWPVIALLDLAGLLRPEAWLFAGVYWLYLWRGSTRAGACAARAGWSRSPRLLWVLLGPADHRQPAVVADHTRSRPRVTLQRPTGLAQRPLLRRAPARRGARPRRPRRGRARRRARALADPLARAARRRRRPASRSSRSRSSPPPGCRSRTATSS